VLGQPFSYEARPPEEFLQNVLTAGADPAYMHCAYENYALYTAGKTPEPGADFSIMVKRGKTWDEFAAAHRAIQV
jgi:NAD(P)H dehydrogenase (quinone)